MGIHSAWESICKILVSGGRSAPCAYCEIARNTKEYQGILNEGAPVEPQSRVQSRRGQYFYSFLMKILMKILPSPNAFSFQSHD